MYPFIQRFSLLTALLLAAATSVSAETQKSILFINSYHPGYEWSDGVERGVEEVLGSKNIELSKFYMDTKRQRTAEQIGQAAADARQMIARIQPDVVITADDNAAKHIIQPFYKDASLPFVFCGVNWDSSVYGFPYSNVTGMEEVSLIASLRDQLQQYAKGKRIGMISIDAISGHRNAEHFEKQLGQAFDRQIFASTWEQWTAGFLELQDSVDMMILENPKGIADWDDQKGLAFIEQHNRIPIGTTHVWLAPYALITIAKIPEEQGRWAASAALEILSGRAPATIPISQNQQGRLYVNIKLAQKLGILIKPELIEIAEILR